MEAKIKINKVSPPECEYIGIKLYSRTSMARTPLGP